VATRNDDVTLSGTVQFAHQKSAAVQAATGITGARRVNDQMPIQAPRRSSH
jgi:osmotically-inducible protein OsmY